MCAARAASSTTRSASFAEDLISYIQTAMNQRPLVVHYNGIVLSQIAESDRMAQTLVLRVSIVFTETIVIPYRSNVASEARTPNIMFTGIRKGRRPLLPKVVLCSGIAGLKRSKKQLSRLFVVVFVESNATAVVVVGALVSEGEEGVRVGRTNTASVPARCGHCSSRRCLRTNGGCSARRALLPAR